MSLEYTFTIFLRCISLFRQNHFLNGLFLTTLTQVTILILLPPPIFQKLNSFSNTHIHTSQCNLFYALSTVFSVLFSTKILAPLEANFCLFYFLLYSSARDRTFHSVKSQGMSVNEWFKQLEENKQIVYCTMSLLKIDKYSKY